MKKYLFKHPKEFNPSKFKVGDKVWIIVDELQENDTYIDKVKEAEILELEPYWFKWWFINIRIFGKVLRLLPYYEQQESVHLVTNTMKRWASDTDDVFTTFEEADNYLKKWKNIF